MFYIVTCKVFIVQAYQTSQYVVRRGDISLGKWRSSFAGSSDGKMNVQSACAPNTRYMTIARQRLAKHVPERCAVNNGGTSVAGKPVVEQTQIIARC
jgi:hypothetical protein